MMCKRSRQCVFLPALGRSPSLHQLVIAPEQSTRNPSRPDFRTRRTRAGGVCPKCLWGLLGVNTRLILQAFFFFCSLLRQLRPSRSGEKRRHSLSAALRECTCRVCSGQWRKREANLLPLCKSCPGATWTVSNQRGRFTPSPSRVNL